MKVLLSIKPQYADKIFEGSKQYEFRRSIFKNKEIKTVVVYASSPVKKVIGEFEIEEILNEDLESLWRKTKDLAGIEEQFFFDYFINKELGYAIKIKSVKKYKTPFCIREKYNISPPQSFIYIKK